MNHVKICCMCMCVCVWYAPPSHPNTLQLCDHSVWYTASAPPCGSFNTHPGPSDHDQMQIYLHMQYLLPQCPPNTPPAPPVPFLFDKLPSWKCRCWISWLCGGCAASRTLWSWIVGWVSVTGWLSVRCWPSPAQLRLLQIRRWGGWGWGGSLRATMIHIKAA